MTLKIKTKRKYSYIKQWQRVWIYWNNWQSNCTCVLSHVFMLLIVT